MKDAGIERIYKVSIKANPKNIEQNRGFAFLELETSRDAQTAFNKLQKNDLLVKQMKIKVAWAEPLAEPDENEMLKVILLELISCKVNYTILFGKLIYFG